MELVLEEMLKLGDMRPNFVQSIRALRIGDLQEAAQRERNVFWRTSLRDMATKADAVAKIVEDFGLGAQKGLTELGASIVRSVPRSADTGFVVVLEHLPTRAQYALCQEILDMFRDVAEEMGDKNVAFRCFFSAD
ncbi:hypothetical protein [Variovorax sp. UC122_21]|uniref:hypothetical protein n=1 Tax=Variovorax TaxID=34072 RepID=UPI001934A4D6|nr:hypothetical protein INQ48_41445 [Variovorax paradoxus]